jgi:hypothetical protein
MAYQTVHNVRLGERHDVVVSGEENAAKRNCRNDEAFVPSFLLRYLGRRGECPKPAVILRASHV